MSMFQRLAPLDSRMLSQTNGSLLYAFDQIIAHWQGKQFRKVYANFPRAALDTCRNFSQSGVSFVAPSTCA